MPLRQDLDLLDTFIRKAAHEPIKHHEVSMALQALERVASRANGALEGNPTVEKVAIQRNLALQALGLPLNATPEQIRARGAEVAQLSRQPSDKH
jgi:hypothetical protein